MSVRFLRGLVVIRTFAIFSYDLPLHTPVPLLSMVNSVNVTLAEPYCLASAVASFRVLSNEALISMFCSSFSLVYWVLCLIRRALIELIYAPYRASLLAQVFHLHFVSSGTPSHGYFALHGPLQLASFLPFASGKGDRRSSGVRKFRTSLKPCSPRRFSNSERPPNNSPSVTSFRRMRPTSSPRVPTHALITFVPLPTGTATPVSRCLSHKLLGHAIGDVHPLTAHVVLGSRLATEPVPVVSMRWVIRSMALPSGISE